MLHEFPASPSLEKREELRVEHGFLWQVKIEQPPVKLNLPGDTRVSHDFQSPILRLKTRAGIVSHKPQHRRASQAKNA